MIGTELAYVRAKLNAAGSKQWAAIAKKVKVNPATLRRIATKETDSRGDILGRLAVLFRTEEARK